jgi:dienelactone hydrolase
MKSEIIINGAAGKPILIDITYDGNKGQCPVILYVHGFNGFKDWGNFDLIAKDFVDAGFTFVKFNFSHNGTSPDAPQDFVDLDAFAENNYTKELEDLDKVMDWIMDKGNAFAAFMQPENLGLIGHSMGGGISIIKTAEDPRIKALVTWASIAQCKTPWGSWTDEKMQEWKDKGVAYYFNGRTQQNMPMHYQLFKDFKHHAERLDIPSAASKIDVPFLICHGSEDTSVNQDNANDIHKASKGSQIFIVPSDHVFGRKHPWAEKSLPPIMKQVVDKNILFFSNLK